MHFRAKTARRHNAMELPTFSPEELAEMSKEELKSAIVGFEEKVSKGSGNLAVLAEYRKREQEFLDRAMDLDEVTAQRDAQKAKYDGLRKQRLEMIILGCNAELESVDNRGLSRLSSVVHEVRRETEILFRRW